MEFHFELNLINITPSRPEIPMTSSNVMRSWKTLPGWQIALAATILLVTFLHCPARADEPAGKEYPVRLFVPYKLHEKYTLAGSATQEVQARIITPGRPEEKVPAENDGRSIRMHDRSLVARFEGPGDEMLLHDQEVQCTDGKKPVEILPTGSVVIVDGTGVDPETKKPDVKFTLNGGVLKKEQLDSLQLVLDAARPESPTTDECYGTTAAQKVGRFLADHREQGGQRSRI